MDTSPDTTLLLRDFNEEKIFLEEHLTKSVNKYRTKFQNEHSSTEKHKELNWEIVESVQLLDSNEKFVCAYKDGASSQQHAALKPVIRVYLRNIFKKKRAPAATHVLVIMLSDERRA